MSTLLVSAILIIITSYFTYELTKQHYVNKLNNKHEKLIISNETSLIHISLLELDGLVKTYSGLEINENKNSKKLMCHFIKSRVKHLINSTVIYSYNNEEKALITTANNILSNTGTCNAIK